MNLGLVSCVATHRQVLFILFTLLLDQTDGNCMNCYSYTARVLTVGPSCSPRLVSPAPGDPDTQEVLYDVDCRPSDASFLALKVRQWQAVAAAGSSSQSTATLVQ